jgi:hypothetical protein
LIFTIVSPPESHEPERGQVTIISPPPESHESKQGREVNALRQKIRHLETQLSKAKATATNTTATIQAPVRPSPNATQADNTPESTTTSSLVRTNISVHEESSIPPADSRASTTTTTIIRHIMYKTRLFGRSHWMTGAIQVSRSKHSNQSIIFTLEQLSSAISSFVRTKKKSD